MVGRLKGRSYHATLLIGGMVGLLPACQDTSDSVGRGTGCSVPATATFEVGTVIRIGEVDPPCEIRFSETGIVLRGDPEGDFPDPGRSIVRSSTGQFYSTNAPGYLAQISRWDVDGTYLSSFGRPGEGPGELGARTLGNFMRGPDDRIHATDGSRSLRWSVFEPDGTYVNSPARDVGQFWAIFDNGEVLSSRWDGGYAFRVTDSTGVIQRRIVPIDTVAMAEAPGGILVASGATYGGGDRFWTGPIGDPYGYTRRGYILEEWSLDGQLLRTIERDVPWFPVSWPPVPRAPEGSAESEFLRKPVVRVEQLHLDDQGLLLVLIRLPTDGWESTTFRELLSADDEELRSLSEFRIEVIDTRSGVVLVSQVMLDGLPFDRLFERTRSGYKLGVSSDFVPEARILQYNLVAR